MGIQVSALHVRRSNLIDASPDRVWKEFESFDRIAAWFGTGHTLEVYEPRLGGETLLSVEIGSSRRAFGGPIVVFDPGAEITFSNNWETLGWAVPTFITLRLSAFFDGCLVELFHHGFERLGVDAASELQSYEAGWDAHHLEALRAIVES